MDVVTIIARNYLPYARVLANSFVANNPDGALHVLLIDDEVGSVDDTREPFRILRPRDLAMDRREYHRMATIYDVMELATAVKPWALDALLNRGCETVTYLDPDIEVFRSLQEVDRLARAHGIILTPHATAPMKRDGRTPTEADILTSGIFNLGFIAVSPKAKPFLAWWMERLSRDCIVDLSNGLFVDQRWVDLGSQCFEHEVLRATTYNVAYWNLDHRSLTEQDGRFLVDGEPLHFFHFSGFDPSVPSILSKHQRGIGRVKPADNLVLKELCARYAKSLIENAEPRLAGDYAYGRAASGLPIDRDLRRRYRSELLADSAADPPDPFDKDDAAAFAAWVDDHQREIAIEKVRRPIRRWGRSVARVALAALTAIYPAGVRRFRERQSSLRGTR